MQAQYLILGLNGFLPIPANSLFTDHKTVNSQKVQIIFPFSKKFRPAFERTELTQSTIFLRTSSFTLRSRQDTNLNNRKEPPTTIIKLSSPTVRTTKQQYLFNRTDTNCV